MFYVKITLRISFFSNYEGESGLAKMLNKLELREIFRPTFIFFLKSLMPFIVSEINFLYRQTDGHGFTDLAVDAYYLICFVGSTTPLYLCNINLHNVCIIYCLYSIIEGLRKKGINKKINK